MKAPQANASSARRWRTNRVAALGFSVVLLPLLIYLLADPATFQRLRDGFFLGIIPLLTVLGMLASAISMMFDRRRTEPFHTTCDEERPTWFRLFLAIAALVSMYVYYRLMLLIGFPVATLLYVVALMMTMGARNPVILAGTAVFVTAFVLFVFTLLGFDLPLVPHTFN